MGQVQQAVLEFDEEVRAPWRPRLAAVPDLPHAAVGGPTPVRGVGPHPSRRPSRVGACRPPAADPIGSRHAAGPDRRLGVPGSLVAVRPVRAAAPVPLRLTRRARRLAVVLALAGGVAVGSWLAPWVNGGGAGLQLAGESSVVVQEGDTLWSIASSLGGGGDVRAVVDEIQRLNHLDGAALVPGQVLQLP